MTHDNLSLHEVRFVCTDRGAHPSRELGVLVLYDDLELRDALLGLVGSPVAGGGVVTESDALAQYEYETLASQGRRLTRREQAHGLEADAPDVDVRMYDERRPDGTLHATWRLRCPTCRRDVQLGHRVARQLVEGLTTRGVGRCDVSLLPANLGSS